MDNNNEVQLIKIEAVVREEMFLDVKKALMDIGVNGITAYQVVGCGIQRGMSEYVRGQKVDVQVLPKIKFEIVVSSEEWEAKTIEACSQFVESESGYDWAFSMDGTECRVYVARWAAYRFDIFFLWVY